jgi:hypothetical protein
MEKKCSKCKVTKPYEEFNKHSKRKDGLQDYCRSCTSWHLKHLYETTSYRESKLKRLSEVRKDLKQKVYEYLERNPCVDCGEKDIVVLDFDHVDPSEKAGTVYSILGNSTRWEPVFEEIKKCQVRCANCHRRRTAKQFRWNKMAGSPGIEPGKRT